MTASAPADTMADTMFDLLARGAEDAPAIGAPGRPWLTHGGLRALCVRTVAALNGMGIGRGDRVAIVLPNGPEAAAVFVAIACGATTAPLNPAYKLEEFAFYLADLGARALVIAEGMDSPARAVAASRGIPVLTLRPGEAAGDFVLRPEGELTGIAARPGMATPEDHGAGAAHLRHHVAAEDRAAAATAT